MRFFNLSVLVLTLLAVACTSGSSSPDEAPTATVAAVDESTPATNAAVVQSPAATPPPGATPPSVATPEPTDAPEATPTTAPPAPTTPPAPTSPPVAAGVPAAIQGYGFPYQLTMPAGTTVVWTNNDAVLHDVTANDDSWSSGLLAEGESYAHTFDAPGTYAYVCRVHPYMTAALIVE